MDVPGIHCCRATRSPPLALPVKTSSRGFAPSGPAFSLLLAASPSRRISAKLSVAAALATRKVEKKPEICTADELHCIDAYDSDWKLALWRYLPSYSATKRKHPLLLLSGVATNAVGYDLCPESSFARFMSGQGFDTWVLELRGSGLSTLGVGTGEDSDASLGESNGRLDGRPSESLMNVADRLSSFFDDGESSTIGSQIGNLSQKLVDFVQGSQQFISPNFDGFQGLFPFNLEDVVRQLDMVSKYDWDLDHYLEEDLPSAVDYIRTQSKPDDGKLLAIGHSMGGILLYALLSRSCSHGRDSGLTSIATLGSALDYTASNSSLKFLLPVADPARALKIPAIPVGTLIAAAHHFSSSPPYVLSWLKAQVTAQGMLHPQALAKLVTSSFCTVPAKLLLQLTTAFQQGGLRDRSGNFLYKQHLTKSKVPVLALAGDKDLICPPAAVYETVKCIPEHLVTYKVFGEPGGPHYGHYDLVGGRWAFHEVYPCIIDFLGRHDV